ncbi:hypothetical protein ACWDWU_12360 [Streptomyces sp. NPDC003442]
MLTWSTRAPDRRRGADVATRLGAIPQQVALAWLPQRSPPMVLIPGTSAIAHSREHRQSR